MTEKELEKRVAEFRKTLVFAQERTGLPSFIIYAFNGGREAGTLGGELVASPGQGDERTAELSAMLAVILLGYLQARLDILKLESSAMYGHEFTLMLHREIADQVEGMSATGVTALQQSVIDLAVANNPCIALAAQLGSPVAGGGTRGDSMGHTATGDRQLAELIPAYAALKRDFESLVEHAATHTGVDLEVLHGAIDEAKDKMGG